MIAWTLLLVGVPACLLLAWVAPPVRALALAVAVALVPVAVSGLILTRRGHPLAAAAVLTGSVWLLGSWAAWSTGGLTSPAVISLFVVVALVGQVQGWSWSAVSAGAGVITAILFAAFGPRPAVSSGPSPWALCLVFAAGFIALGAVQVLLARNASRAQARVAREHARRRTAEKRLLDVVDNAPFGAFVCALEDRRLLRVVHVNQAASDVLGVDAARFVGSNIERTFSALSGKPLLNAFRTIATSGGTFHAESVPYFVDGRSATLELHAFQIGPDSMAVFFSDETERQREQVQIQRMAFHDHLTRLPNRSLLLDRLDVALASAQRHGYQVALLFIDLDGFKPINDRYGHAFGDELLVAVAKRLSDSARQSDTVARFGGDEFTVLVPDAVDREHVEVFAQKLGVALAQPFRIGEHTVSVTASIGVSITTPDDHSPTALLEHADMAMYQVKRAGRNGYQVF